MKATIEYVCQSCGAKAPKQLGRCPVCGEWGTYEEEVTERMAGSKLIRSSKDNPPQRLHEVVATEETRLDMHNGEFNRVLGGGLVPGSLVLLGGEPGIGKSTLALQVLMQMGNKRTLYASGEESVSQLKLRAERLSGKPENLYIVSETSLEKILQHVGDLQPEVVVVDSIQTIGTESVESTIGSLSQVRECAAMLLKYAKENNVPFLIVGHITKDGALAGPKVLEQKYIGTGHLRDAERRTEGGEQPFGVATLEQPRRTLGHCHCRGRGRIASVPHRGAGACEQCCLRHTATFVYGL